MLKERLIQEMNSANIATDMKEFDTLFLLWYISRSVWRSDVPREGMGGRTPTFLKYDPWDLSKNAGKISRKEFPRICESLEGVTQIFFGPTPLDPLSY